MSRSRRSARASVIGLLLAACQGVSAPSPSAIGPNGTTEQTLSPSTAPSLPTPSSTPTGGPPSVLVPPSDSYVAGLVYTCGGADFPIEVLEGPPDAHRSHDPPAKLLNGLLGLLPNERWWLVNRTATLAEYVGEPEPGDYWFVYTELVDGQWRAGPYGDCQMRAVVEDAVVDTWWIPSARWPDPGDATLQITIRDECPETVGGRMLDPIIRYGTDAILIVIPTRPPGPPRPHCGFTSDREQLARVSLQLDEPVGARALLDGESWPARDAHSRSEPLIWCCG